MGHLVGKDVFRKLGSKIDGLEMRAPWNDKLYAVLKELYTADEADVVVKMPYGLANFKEVQRATGYREAELHKVLDSLTAKGLVMDIWANNDYQYCISPMIVGIFEFTMMRMGQADSKVWAKVLYDYMEGDGTWLGGNYTKDSRIAPLRTLPHEDAIKPEEYCEVLDYEKASSLIASANKFAIALCSCRHEKQHVGELKCSTPLEKCSQFGYAAEVMIRHKMAREVSRSEMEDNFAESKALGLVLNADNTQRNGKFICHCCKCCCNTMLGVTSTDIPTRWLPPTIYPRSTTRLATVAGNVRRLVLSTPLNWCTMKIPPPNESRLPESIQRSASVAASALSSVPLKRAS